MNYKMILHTLGWLLIFEAGFFTVPMITGLVYLEWRAVLAFFLSALIAVGAGLSSVLFIKPKTSQLYSKDGYVIVALRSLCSLFGHVVQLLIGHLLFFLSAHMYINVFT